MVLDGDHFLYLKHLERTVERRAGWRMAQGSEDVVAVDGEQAIAEARRLRPRVILMDLKLPGVDGVAATRATGC